MTPPAHPGATRRAPRRNARRRAQIRRRRATALTSLAVLTTILVLYATSSGNSSHAHPQPRPPATASTTTREQPRSVSTHDTPTAEDDAIDRLLAREPFISAGGSERREIALTFDDGPGPYTPQLLDQLQRLHVPATFFEIGFMFQWFHDSATRELWMGDVIGDHTETHPEMAELSTAAQQNEIVDQTQWVRKYGGPFPRLWRPPYGSYNATTLAILRHEHMLMVLWTVDTNDYLRPGVSVIVHNTLAGARPGAIILMHDAGGDRTQTIAALPLIVRALRARGYRLVTVPQLILNDPPQHTEHLPTAPAGD
jgi:peptidoglycan-N-acetylglucosamine deacetylase